MPGLFRFRANGMPKTDLTSTLAAIGKFIDRYGAPLGMLVFGAYVLMGICQWAAPRVDKVVDSHNAFLKETTETQRQLASGVSDLARDHADTKEMVRDIHQAVIGNRPIAERKPERPDEP